MKKLKINLKERATQKLVRESTATGIPVSEKNQ